MKPYGRAANPGPDMTMDFNPPKILAPAEYLAAIVLLPGDDFIRYSVYRSGVHSEVTDAELSSRLRSVIAHLESKP